MAIERGLSPRTATEYCRDIDRFAKQLDRPLVKAKTKHIRTWIVGLMADGSNQPQSVHRKIAALKAYYKFLMRERKRDDNPVDAIELPKCEKRLPVCATKDEVNQILDVHIHRRTPALEARDTAMLELMYGSGLRRAEVCGVNIGHIDYDRQMLHVVGKGNKERAVFLTQPAIDSIRAYLELRGGSGNDPLFLTTRKSRMTVRQLWVIFKQIREAANLTKHVTPHTLRHSFATHMVENGADIVALKELLGHESIQTTMVYTNVSLSHMRKTFENTHPRATKTEVRDDEGDVRQPLRLTANQNMYRGGG